MVEKPRWAELKSLPTEQVESYLSLASHLLHVSL